MDLNEAYKIVRADMDKHGLTGWRLVWMDKKTVAGTCRTTYWSDFPQMTRGIISLSRPFFEKFGEAEVKETGLHEIAHALDKPNNPAHGPEWRKIARRIGSTGERCVAVDAPRPDAKYHGSCPQGHQYRKHRSSHALVNGDYWCPTCKKKSNLDPYIVWVETATNRVVSSRKTTPSVSIMTQVKKPVTKMETRKVVTKTELTWKQKFDQGMTSFGDDW